jgi:hypothetical protein
MAEMPGLGDDESGQIGWNRKSPGPADGSYLGRILSGKETDEAGGEDHVGGAGVSGHDGDDSSGQPVFLEHGVERAPGSTPP